MQPITIERSGESTVTEVPLRLITPNPRQPRRLFDEEKLKELSDSIVRYGILQPLTCRRLPSGGYELIAGERRFRAACLAGFYSVPCIIMDTCEEESAELAIIENLQREDLNIFEEAAAISSLLIIYNMTQAEAAERLSVSQSYVANKLRLLRFSEEERLLILENSLSERHARCLLRLTEEKERHAALLHIISRGLNVSSSERYVESLLAERDTARRQKVRFIFKDLRLFYNSIDRAAELVRTSGVPVKIEKNESKEGVVITVSVGNVSRETIR